MEPVRLMYGIDNVEDLKLAREAGCNVVFCTNFDSKSEGNQRAYMVEVKRLGLQVTWNLWGGDWTHRDETILRWKDEPAVFAWYFITEPYVVGGGCYLNKQQQREKYNHFKSLTGPGKPFMQDRALFNPHFEYWAEDCLDILMVYSYAYEFPEKLDWIYDRMFANLTSLKTRTYPVIPLIQCFWAGNYIQPPVGAVKDQYDRWERFLRGKGWFEGHCGFYRWEGYSGRDIKHHPYLYNEIKALNTGVAPPPPPPPPPPPNGEITTNIVASEDCYSYEAAPSTPFNARDKINCHAINGKQGCNGFIKFSLSGIPADSVISTATLYMYCSEQRYNTVGNVRQCSDNWSENSLTWNNQPASGASIGNFSVGTGWKNLSVTPYVQAQWAGDKLVSFKLIPTPITGQVWPGQRYRPSEYATDKPYLAVTYTTPPPPPPPPPVFTCPQCGATFATQGELDTHITTMTKLREQITIAEETIKQLKENIQIAQEKTLIVQEKIQSIKALLG